MLMERRREDVRDQMIELSNSAKAANGSSSSNGNGGATNDAAVADAARQRRAAEREGRRRRRQQQRQQQLAGFGAKITHHEGMSSDDELSTLEQANIKVRSENFSYLRERN